MLPYPNEFPVSAITLMWDKVNGSPVPTGELVNACWNVLGFGLGKILPGGQMIAGEPAGWTDDSNDAAVLEYAIKNGIEPIEENGVVQGVIPWILVIRIAIKLILGAAS